MGCDIHPIIEIRKNGNWELCNTSIWDFRDYRVFGFLAGIRNYSGVQEFKLRGFPSDMSKEARDKVEYFEHSPSHLTLAELLSVDYDKEVWDRRVTIQIAPNFFNGGATTDNPEEGERLPLKEFLGQTFMDDLETLKSLGKPEDVRVIFWFDS